MINEQREAIKILKEIQESNRAWLMQTKEENCEKIYLKDIEAIDTVLSLIKEQEKQIENTTENYKNLIEDISMLAKELGLEDDATIDEIYIAIKRLKQKDKQIDLMAEELWGEFYLTYMNGYGINSKEELKQYFERKVEDVKD